MRALLSQRLTLRFAVLALLAAVALAATATVAFARYATTEALPTDSTVAVEDLYVRVYGEGPYDDNDGWGPYYLRYVGNEEVVDVAEDLDAQGCILGTKVTSTYKLFEAPHADVRQVLLPDVALLASDVDGQVLAANLFGNGVGDRAIDVMYRDGVKTEAEGEGPHAAADLTATAFDGCTNATTYLYVTEAHLEGEPGHRIFKQEVPHAYVSNEVQGIRCLFKMNADLTAVLFDPHPNPAWTTMSDGGMVGTFYCCTGLVELPGNFAIPSTVTVMDNAFCGCTNLASLPDALALPDGVVSLSRAFQYCRSLASLPDSLVLRSGIVGDGLYATFNGCESLTSLPKGVRIPLGASNIGALFQNCKSLVLPNDFTLAPSVTSANRAFASCSSLTSLPSGFRLPSDLTSIQGMFAGCTALETLPSGFKLPANVVDATLLFSECRSLRSLPEGFTLAPAKYIDQAFWFCTSLEGLPTGFAFPENLKVAESVFHGCSSLASLPDGFTLPVGMTDAAKLFYGCSSLAALPDGFAIPETMKVLKGAFNGCSSMEADIMLPDGLKNLDACFDGAGAASGRYDDAGKDVGAGAGRYAMAVRYNPTANDYVKDVAAANANDRIVFVAVVRNWEKVYEAGAPYQDARGTFYLHYVGEGDGFGLVDVQEEMDADGGTAYGQGTTLLGVSVTSTYKMFDGLPAGVEYVVLPDMSLLTHATFGGISPRLFGDGLGDGRHVDVAYRDGRGQQAVYLPADLTATAFDGTAGATVYLYLESAHLTAHSYDWGAIHGTYDGTVPRVFVSRDINDVNAIATRNAFLRGVLFDPRGNERWTKLGSRTEEGGAGAFEGCVNLTLPDNFALPRTATGMIQTFAGCTSLTTLPDGFALPDGVTWMYRAFMDCSNLASLPEGFEIPSKVTDLREVFSNCSSLTRLPDAFRLPEGATDLSYLFGSCAKLEAVPDTFSFPEKVTSVEGLFYGCSSLATVPNDLALPANDGLNAAHLFFKCALAELPAHLIPDGAKIELRYAFASMPELTSLPPAFLGSGVASVGNAFANCKKLASVPADLFSKAKGITSIDSMFYNCSGLTTIPEGLFSGLDRLASAKATFKNCTSLTALPANLFSGAGQLETLAETFYGCNNLVSVAEDLFAGMPNLKVLDSVFEACSALPSVPEGLVPCTVTDLKYTFFRCAMLENAPLRLENVRYMGGTFSDSGLVEPPTLPAALEDASYAFANTPLKVPPTFPQSVKTLSGALQGCEKLTEASNIPDNAEKIDSLYYGCSSLTTFPADWRVPDSVRSMEQLFLACTSLTAVPATFRMPEGVTSVANVFYNCPNLESLPEGLTIPSTATSMERMFYKCGSLKKLPDTLLLPEGMQNMSYAFYYAGLTTLPAGFTIPSTVTNLQDTFAGSKMVSFPEGFRLPEGITSLSETFNYMDKLESLPEGFTLPESVTSLGYTFCYCRKLSGEIAVPAGVTYLRDAFKDVGSQAPLNYDDAGNRVADGTGTYAFVLRYDPACTAAANYAPTGKVLKLPIGDPVAVSLDAGDLAEGEGPTAEPLAEEAPAADGVLDGQPGDADGEADADGAAGAPAAPTDQAGEGAADDSPDGAAAEGSTGAGGPAGASPDETGGAFASDAGSTSNAGSSSDASTAGAEDASTPLPLTDAGLTAAFTSLTTGLPVYLVWSRRSGRIDAAKPVRRRPTKRRVPRERSGR